MSTDAQATPVEIIDDQDAMSMASFEALLDSYDYDQPKRGEILSGVVLEVDDDQVILDVGTKHDAIVPRQDLERLDEATLDMLVPGAELKVFVLRPLTTDGELLVSINKAITMVDWERAETLMNGDEMIEVPVIGYNKGGALVEFGRLRGFVPNSQLVEVPRGISREQQNDIKGDLVGSQLPVKVIEVNQRRNRLVLSETAARRSLRADLLEELEVGSTVTGRVVNIVEYGAFVDIGGLNGLIHISKLAWQHVDHPGEVVQIGEEVDVRIDKVDVERERISLNRQACIPDPWEKIHDTYEVDDLVTGSISSVADFGVFVDIPDGITGLVHVSEMESYNIQNPRDWAREGEELLVRVISIDADRQRIGLSLDRVSQEELYDWMTNRGENPEDAALADNVDLDQIEAELDDTPEMVEETEPAVDEDVEQAVDPELAAKAGAAE